MLPQRFPIPDGQLDYVPRFLPAEPADVWFLELIDDTPWRHEHMTMYGRRVAVPRLTAWFGDAGTSYTYSDITLDPEPWTAALLEMRKLVEQHADTTFNSVLLNLYRDGNDSVSWHSDDEPELGPEPVIASLSLGQERMFRMKHKVNREQPPVEIELGHGSLLVMSGTTQRFWKHEVPKRRSKIESDIFSCLVVV